MRVLFQKKEIQEQIKNVFEESGYTYISNLYWDEFVDFLLDENNSFSDILSLLNEEYHVEEEDALKISDELFTLLYPYRKELKNFFGVGTSIPSNAGIQTPSFNASPRTMVDDQKRGAGFRRPATGTAQFYFSPEDEEEIRKVVLRQAQDDKVKMDAVYDRVAEDVMKKAKME